MTSILRFFSCLTLACSVLLPLSVQAGDNAAPLLKLASLQTDTHTSQSPAALAKPPGTTVQLASISAAVVDYQSGSALFAKHADLPLPIASITKLMTAMVVLDAKQPLNERISFTEEQRRANNNYYSRIRVGSTLPRKDVMRIALMSSENLAAAALGHNYPGGIKAFVKAMNSKARALGMQHTLFVDSTGLSEKNVSTAADLALMVSAAAKYPEINQFSTTPSFTARFKNPRYVLGYGNTNSLVHRSNWEIDITKTGYLNEAGRCLVMLTKIDGREVVMVLLNSFGKRTPVGDAGRIKRWLQTGSSGAISQTARAYEKKIMAQLSAVLN